MGAHHGDGAAVHTLTLSADTHPTRTRQVPIMETVHGALSMFNYITCPWEDMVSLLIATLWAVVTILKGALFFSTTPPPP